jgi:hypothetical protein
MKDMSHAWLWEQREMKWTSWPTFVSMWAQIGNMLSTRHRTWESADFVSSWP